jgi:hypothetical protein
MEDREEPQSSQRLRLFSRIGAMTVRRGTKRTARNIQLYSSAYRIAWKQISSVRKREQPDISLQLHASIRRQLNQGATDPLSIATEAFKALD